MGTNQNKEAYSLKLKAYSLDYEGLCIRCGGCCGAFDDPCRHLKKDEYGKYFCEIYEKRFGLRETVSGEKFHCVRIREILNTHWKNDYLCAYKKKLKFKNGNE